MSSSYHKSVFQVDIFHHFSPSDDSHVKTQDRDKGQAQAQVK